MKKKTIIVIVIVLAVCALIVFFPTILRGIVSVKAGIDSSSEMITGTIVEDMNSKGKIVVDIGNVDYNLEINTNNPICFGKLGFPCSKDKLTKGKRIAVYAKSSFVYDESNYKDRGEKRVDFVPDCRFVWIIN